ncbi:MAG: hypothetical protein KGI94_09050 [Paracoccaceae bacterium]|nr:hypothetical protein [Paracoccaceae bacterium]MDE3122645.1 hypothetical protein [Paracoccaceae bacterium]
MDSFKDFPNTPVSPVRDAVPVTPDDATPLSAMTRALYVAQAGDVAVTMAGGQDVIFAAVPGGTLLPIRVTDVKATGTTASGLLALW